jgi:hypothetical protein
MAYTMANATMDAPWMLECPSGVDRIEYCYAVGISTDMVHSLCARGKFDEARTYVQNHEVLSPLRKKGHMNMISHYEKNWSSYVWDKYLS